MPETDTMKCPECGAEMNHHADKLDYGAADEAPDAFDESGAVVIEAHTCPACGRTATRAAAP